MSSSTGAAGDTTNEIRWWAEKSEAIRGICVAIELAEKAMDRVVDDAGGLGSGGSRAQSHAFLAETVDHLLQGQTKILITGMVGRGKSFVATALLDGEQWTKSGAGTTTARPVHAVWGERRGAALVRQDESMSATVEKALEMATPGFADSDVTEIIHYIPHELLRLGAHIVDSPGLGDPGAVSYDEMVEQEIRLAHVIIVVLICPPGPVDQERRLIESVSAYANRTIIVANCQEESLKDPDEPEAKAKYLAMIDDMVAAAASTGEIAAYIPVIVMDAKRAAKAAPGDLDAGGRDALQHAVASVIDREVWQERLADAEVAVFDARRAAIARGTALLGKAREGLEVRRELIRLQDREEAIARDADKAEESLLATQNTLAGQAGSIMARSYWPLREQLDRGYLPSQREIDDLTQRGRRLEQAGLELLANRYRDQMDRHLGIQSTTLQGSGTVEQRFVKDRYGPVVVAAVARALLGSVHPKLSAIVDIFGVAKVADVVAPKAEKIAKLRGQIAQAERQVGEKAAAWAGQMTDSAIQAVRTVAADQLAEIARRRQDVTSPVHPDQARAFKQTVEDIIRSLEELDLGD